MVHIRVACPNTRRFYRPMGMGTAPIVLYKFGARPTPILKGWSPTLEGASPPTRTREMEPVIRFYSAQSGLRICPDRLINYNYL